MVTHLAERAEMGQYWTPMVGQDCMPVDNVGACVLSGTKVEIEAEIRDKVTAAALGGGYIFHSDHSVPPSVSYDNYILALEMPEKYGAY